VRGDRQLDEGMDAMQCEYNNPKHKKSCICNTQRAQDMQEGKWQKPTHSLLRVRIRQTAGDLVRGQVSSLPTLPTYYL